MNPRAWQRDSHLNFLMSSRHFTILITLGLLTVLVIVLVCGSEHAYAKTWYVDDDGGADYEKIQDAIDASQDGDTIRVWEGTYYEIIRVHRTVTLIGNGSVGTVIDGQGVDYVVNITADRVNMSGFMVTGGGSHWMWAGISIVSSNNIVTPQVSGK